VSTVLEGPPLPADFLVLDPGLTEEEQAVAAVVQDLLADRAAAQIGSWFEDGLFPRELIAEFGAIGLLGMHLEGYGCAGMSARAYGVACRELEAVDSGLRSFRLCPRFAWDVRDLGVRFRGAQGAVASAAMRHAANLESVMTYEGTEEIHTLIVGETLTGLSAFRNH
jgi:alkylation response protein AidB-like acyl-CoA dehydrogenase